MACKATPVDGQTLLEKAASVSSAVPAQMEAQPPGSGFAEQYVLERDPAFAPVTPSPEQVAACKRCLVEKVIGLGVVLAVGLTLFNVGRSIFRKGPRK